MCIFSKIHSVFLIVFLSLSQTGFTQTDIANINSPGVTGAANRYFSHLEDKGASLTIDDLLQSSYQDLFTPGTDQILNQGYTPSAIWLHARFNYPNLSGSVEGGSEFITRYFSLDYSLLDSVEFYVIESDRVVQKWQTGDSYAFDTRPMDYSRFLFPVEFKQGDVKDIYIRVQSTSSMRLPLSIWEPTQFHDTQRPKLLLDGLYFGILLLMFLYNLCLFATVRDISYFYYIAYILSIVVFQLAMTGYGFEYLWPDTPEVNEFLIPLSICAVSVFVLAFGQRILDLKHKAPLLYYFFSIIIILELAGALASLILPYAVVIQSVIVFAVLVAAFKLYASIQQAIKGIYTAKLFLFAWFTLLCGAISLAATSMGWLPASFLTTNAFMIGSAVEVIVLSFTLAERLNQFNKDKALAESHARESLQSMNQSLRETNRIKDEFLTTISHELRTPMNGVLGCLQHMQQGASKDHWDQYLNHADRSARHMMLLVDSLLAYTEVQSGKLQLQNEPFRILELIDRSRLLFADICEKKGISLHLHTDEQLPNTVFGDSYRISQIFNNLIDNAIKFTHSGEITIELDALAMDTQSQSMKLRFSVTDTGIGIDADKQAQIFETFRQIDNATSRGYGGLGIGLSVVKSLVDKMDGFIELESRQGNGSRFTVNVPCRYQNNDLTHRIEEKARMVPKLLNRLRVLVVEDNPVNQLVVKGLLSKHGHEVVTANNGEQALELLQEAAVDVVLMDCQMPIMDGFEATRKIRNMEAPLSRLPIIAVTANAMSDDRHQCIVAGMNDYLCKPIDAQILNRKIVYWANSSARRRLAS